MKLVTLGAIAATLLATTALAQGPNMTPPQMVAAQQAAMARLSALDGVWRGTGWMIDNPTETPRKMTSTKRVGPFLDGAVKVIEDKNYMADGSVGFHTFNTIYFDAQKGEYVMNARAGGRSGNFSFQATPTGYTWDIGGGGRGLHYTGTIKDGVWTEIGESVDPSRPPIRMSEWTAHRVGSTDWPEAGALKAR